MLQVGWNGNTGGLSNHMFLMFRAHRHFNLSPKVGDIERIASNETQDLFIIVRGTTFPAGPSPESSPLSQVSGKMLVRDGFRCDRERWPYRP